MTKAEVIAELEKKISEYKGRKEAAKMTDPLWQSYFDLVYAYTDALGLVSRMEDNGK